MSGWSVSPVALTIPLSVARQICENADRFDARDGDRVTASGATLVIRRPSGPSSGRVSVVGSFTMRWRFPQRDDAMIESITWDPSQGETETTIRSVILGLAVRAGLLRGTSTRPQTTDARRRFVRKTHRTSLRQFRNRRHAPR
jgi:hypothetical protein